MAISGILRMSVETARSIAGGSYFIAHAPLTIRAAISVWYFIVVSLPRMKLTHMLAGKLHKCPVPPP
jgi:hypothetical protein